MKSPLFEDKSMICEGIEIVGSWNIVVPLIKNSLK